MKAANTAYIIVGKIGSTYGVQGWIKIHTYTEFSNNILKYTPWYLQQNKSSPWITKEIEESRMHHNSIIVKFVGISTPEEARLLTGAHIGILRSQLPRLKEGEYYWSDLVGLTVINKSGEVLGKVIYLMTTGSNDVLVVKGEKEHAIPYLKGSVITHIDLNKQEIHVDWELV